MLNLVDLSKFYQDNGTEVRNKLFFTIAEQLGEYKIHSPPYHCPSKRKIEGFHGFLKVCISKQVSKSLEWDEVNALRMHGL